jgi:AraC-like DNA-binding protein
MAALREADSFKFSTDDLPEAIRSDVVRELYERATLPHRPEPFEPVSISPCVNITKRALPNLSIMFGTLGGLHQAVRSRGSVASSEDDLLVAVNLSGCSIAQRHGREFVLRDGDAMLVTRGSAGFKFCHPMPVRFMGFRVPREAIAPLVGSLDDDLLQIVPHGTEALNLLVSYVRAIYEQPYLSTPELLGLVATHVHDLIAATVGATRDGLAHAEGRGIRAARLRAIMTDITANLGNCDLTAAAVAQRLGVTPRYVHKLFEGEGLTFSSFVIDQRLSRAHRILSDPRFKERSISSVAFHVGFGDLSYFNRSFRRRYDATPSDIRYASDHS